VLPSHASSAHQGTGSVDSDFLLLGPELELGEVEQEDTAGVVAGRTMRERVHEHDSSVQGEDRGKSAYFERGSDIVRFEYDAVGEFGSASVSSAYASERYTQFFIL
jgi:hypothetical protein